jgi:predicted nucleotidyltransferase
VDGGSLVEQRIRDELNILRDTIVRSIPVERIYLFGSYASGTPRPDSDLDLYVVMPDNTGVREIDAIKIIRRAIRDKKTLPVDVVVGKRNRFDQRSTAPTIERQIAAEGVVLYG